MPWDRSQPADPKYRSKAHRDERAKWQALMDAQGYLVCAQPVCIMPTRTIVGAGWHLGHADDGVSYLGPTHSKCNVTDGAKRGRARQDKATRWRL